MPRVSEYARRKDAKHVDLLQNGTYQQIISGISM